MRFPSPILAFVMSIAFAVCAHAQAEAPTGKPPEVQSEKQAETAAEAFVPQLGRAAIIKANAVLFQPRNPVFVTGSAAALVIYTTDPSISDEALLEMVDKLSVLEGTTPDDPELALLAKKLTKDWVDNKVLALPPTITDGRDVYLSNLTVWFGLLPKKYLVGFDEILKIRTREHKGKRTPPDHVNAKGTTKMNFFDY